MRPSALPITLPGSRAPRRRRCCASARRVETPYEEYELAFLPRRRERARSLVAAGLCDTVERADKDTTDHK